MIERIIDTVKYEAEPGDRLEPDGWNGQFETLEKSDGFKDSSFPGCQFRLPSGNYNSVKYAVNITIANKKPADTWWWKGKVRVKIEWVGDGKPSTFSRGWLYFN